MVMIAMLAFGAGCAVRARGTVEYSDPEPALVYVSPGVSVVENYDQPVFYADNYYWRYDGGIWYRSGTYRGGWVTTYDVPVSVRRIDRPHRYVHVRGQVVRRAGPVTRDHRGYRRR